MSDFGIQHKQAFALQPGIGFSDDGERVPVVMPEQEQTEESEFTDGNSPPDASDGLMELIALLTENATPLQTGQRMHLLAYFLGVSSFKTQTELAAELNISPGRVSQISKEIPAQLRALCILKGRTAKPQSLGRKEKLKNE